MKELDCCGEMVIDNRLGTLREAILAELEGQDWFWISEGQILSTLWFCAFSLRDVGSRKHIIIIHIDASIARQNDLMCENHRDQGGLSHPVPEGKGWS
jgi:hypothetical protein